MDLVSKLYAIRQCLVETHTRLPDKRETKVNRQLFIFTLIFGCVLTTGKHRSIDGLCRSVKRLTHKKLDRSGFHQRLNTKTLTQHLTTVFSNLIRVVTDRHEDVYGEILSHLSIRDIFILDSTSNTLPERAKAIFPAPRTNVVPASVKIHGLFSLIDNILHWVELSPAKVHDRKAFPDLDILIGSLIIFDLGYWDYTLFNHLNKKGIYFLSRVKSNAKVRIIQTVHGIPKSCIGWGLFSKKALKYRGKMIEMFCNFNLKGGGEFNARVIGFWNSHEHQYFLYVTNLTCPGKLAYPLYRLRWQLELFWKENKSYLALDQINSAQSNIVRNLILANMIASIVFGTLALGLLDGEPSEIQVARSIQRTALVFDCLDLELYSFLKTGSKKDLRTLLNQMDIFKNDLFDPNLRRRKSSLGDVWRILKDH